LAGSVAAGGIFAAGRASAQIPRYDLVIRGGEVLDPSQGLRGRRDVAIRNGLVVAVQNEIPAAQAVNTIDAAGRIVCPGLVDLHAHVYPEVSAIGLPADELVPFTATTTYVSAGDAGSNTFSLFRHVPCSATLSSRGRGHGCWASSTSPRSASPASR